MVRAIVLKNKKTGYNATEDNEDDIRSKLSKKRNESIGVSTRWAIHDNTPLLRVMSSWLSLVERAGGLWMHRVEFLYDLWCIFQVHCILPAVMFWAPALPVHKVLQLLPLPVPLWVQHHFYFVLGCSKGNPGVSRPQPPPYPCQNPYPYPCTPLPLTLEGVMAKLAMFLYSLCYKHIVDVCRSKW